MSPGPLRRFIGALGLLALAPVAWLLTSGAISGLEAAKRGAIILIVTAILGRVATAWLVGVVRSLDRQNRARPHVTEDGA